jgi:DNA-binding NarL/FixJ family response regulator
MLADSQQFVLWGLEKLINTERPRMEVVGKAENGTDAKRLAREMQPDILLLDLYLGGGKGAELVPHFVKDGHTRVVIFTGERDLGTVDRAVFNGARGLVRKEDDPATLINAIQKVHEGELWLDRRTTSRIFFEFARAGGKAPVDSVIEKIESLTRKERTIVSMFANMPGAPNKKVAELLFMSEHTLRNHLTSIFDKLHVSGRFELFEFSKLHRDRLTHGRADTLSEFPAQE